jgi:hypothetical protein
LKSRSSAGFDSPIDSQIARFPEIDPVGCNPPLTDYQPSPNLRENRSEVRIDTAPFDPVVEPSLGHQLIQLLKERMTGRLGQIRCLKE